jgi:hypothetical protein
LRESDRADASMWQEVPMIRQLRSRSRKRIGKQETEPVYEQHKQRRKTKLVVLEERQEEWQLLLK